MLLHQGGLWESAIKSMKYHLSQVKGDYTLTLEEFSTLIAQVEVIFNFRPITLLSNDLTQITALTRGHFLTFALLVAIPEACLEYQLM